MKWISVKDRLPTKPYNYHAKIKNFDGRSTYNGASHFNGTHFAETVSEWLDESPLEALDSQPSFSLQQALDIWKDGYSSGDTGNSADMDRDMKRFFMYKFKIDL